MHKAIRYFIAIVLAGCVGFSATQTFAQTDYKQQFTIAKKLYTDGKYALAMENFKKLIPYDQNTPPCGVDHADERNLELGRSPEQIVPVRLAIHFAQTHSLLQANWRSSP